MNGHTYKLLKKTYILNDVQTMSKEVINVTTLTIVF